MITDNTTSRRARGDALLKTQPRDFRREIFEHLRTHKHAETLAWLKERGLVVKSGSTLSDFWEWHQKDERIGEAARFCDGYVEECKKQLGDNVTPERLAEIREMAQVMFELRAAAKDDKDVFIGLRTLAVKQQGMALARDRFVEQLKSGIEKGLDALQAELKGNPEALALFDRMKAIVIKSVEARAA